MPATRPGTTGAVISGWGSALPDRIVTNDDLAATLDTCDEWITTRTGMPFSMFAVAALEALQKSMMFSPRWPSAGPIGGEGFAAPAGTVSLM